MPLNTFFFFYRGLRTDRQIRALVLRLFLLLPKNTRPLCFSLSTPRQQMYNHFRDIVLTQRVPRRRVPLVVPRNNCKTLLRFSLFARCVSHLGEITHAKMVHEIADDATRVPSGASSLCRLRSSLRVLPRTNIVQPRVSRDAILGGEAAPIDSWFRYRVSHVGVCADLPSPFNVTHVVFFFRPFLPLPRSRHLVAS